jgi:hypothetical protein
MFIYLVSWFAIKNLSANEKRKRLPAPHMRTIRPPCRGQLKARGLPMRHWSTVEGFRGWGYANILLFPVNGYRKTMYFVRRSILCVFVKSGLHFQGKLSKKIRFQNNLVVSVQVQF